MENGKTNNFIQTNLNKLFELSYDLFDYEDGKYFEISLISTLFFIKSYSGNYKDFIINFLINSMENKTINSFELIPFCMHELRWIEIYDYVVEKYNKAIEVNSWNEISFYGSIINCYDDSWEDKDLYEYYNL
ncbi:hypothetical protein L1281_002108 [Neisseria sp. HSC-16F19]|nr:hypothetical protein [Neisseria sp. HSC-16F19]MCP2041506.1 hypothetical protein [Neisseria sp. HSC-16F19]